MKRHLFTYPRLIVLALMWVSAPVFNAVGVVQLDGAVSTNMLSSGSSISISHTTGTGDNRLTLVGVSWNSGSSAQNISSVTFTPSGGSAINLTAVRTQQVAQTMYRYAAIYSLLNPSSGQAGTVKVTFGGSVANGTVVGVANFAGVDQTTSLGSSNGASATNTTPSLTLTGLNGDELVFDTVFIGGSPSPTLTNSTSQTRQWTNSISNASGAASTKQATGASVTMSWTASASGPWASVAVPIKPAADTTPPTVTINQAAGQLDPTNAAPINFSVVFSKPVTDFATGDVTLSGTAGATTAIVTGSSTNYNVAVSGMTGSGTVIATIAAGVAHDSSGNANTASTSTDNTVTYDITAPTVTINQAAGQPDPTNAAPINFTVVFSKAVTDFVTGDVTLGGTAGATTAIVSGSGTTYNVAVSGMTGSGTVIATVAAGVAHDAAGNANTASTSTDNTVTYVGPKITLDSAVSTLKSTNTVGSSLTVTNTTGTGDNRLMLVGVSWNANTIARTIASVTFTPNGGTATNLTEVKTQQIAPTMYRYAALYSLVSPPSGQTGTVTVAFSGSVTNGIVMGVANFAGVDQTTPLGSSNGASATNTTPSVTLTGLNGDELVFDTLFIGGSPPPTLTNSTGQTQRWTNSISNTSGAASTRQAAGASVTMSWTASASGPWAIVAVPIKPASTDTTPPVITTCANNQTISANANCQAAIPDLTSQVVATDDSGSVTITQSPVAGTLVGLGNTVVTLTAKDAANNQATCQATITVADTTPPTITTCANNQTISAGANCQAAIPDLTSQVVASDTCSAVTITQSPVAGTLVGLGNTVVTLTAKDAANNQANCQATITVVDTTPPTITTCATGQTISAGANCQAAIPDLTSQVVASDTCSAVTITQSPVAGTLVGLGNTVVTLTAKDAANNQATCQATITVVDTTPPTITTCANNRTISAGANCQAAIPDLTSQVVASDTCSAVTISQSPVAGTLVGLGNTVVTLTAKDAANNQATCQATITVVDTTPPTITTCATNMTINADTNCQAVIPDLTPQVAASDTCSAVTITQSPVAGALVGLGDTVVTLTAKDAANNQATCQATITVVDATPPVIATCATNMTINADANCQASIPDLTSQVVASDTCSAVTITQSPVAGTLVGLGDHLVTVTASDAATNQAFCQATITVVDTTPPTITTCAANRTISADANCQAAIPDLTSQVVASDTCSAVTITQSPVAGTLVGLGNTVVTLTAKDAANNQATCQATITVVDTTPPTITTCAANRTISAGANCQAAIPDLTSQVVASDTCSAVTITQSPVAGTLVGLGNTVVTLTAKDAANNQATCQATITVVDSGVPDITAQPQSMTNLVCTTATFTVTATSCSPIGYQWLLGTNLLSGENASTLTITNVQSTNSGDYTVVLTNAAGSATSQVATLTVLLPAAPTLSAGPVMLANGHFSAGFTGTTNMPYTIECATNPLGPWETLTHVNADATGLIQLEDCTTPPPPIRFYRVVYP